MSRNTETHCYLCGLPCETVDHGRHLWCEQEENARIAAWEEDILAEVSTHPESNESHGQAA